MKVVRTPDIVEISSLELEEILAAAIRERVGRRMSHISWINVENLSRLGAGAVKEVHLNVAVFSEEP